VTAIVLSAAVVVGVGAALVRPLAPSALLVSAVSALTGMTLSWCWPTGRRMAAAALFATLGALRVTLWPAPTTDDLAPWLGRSVVVIGQVMGAPTRTERSATFVLAADAAARPPAVGPPWLEPVTARVQVVGAPGPPSADLNVGERVAVSGYLAAPSGPPGAPWLERLRREHVFSQLVFPRLALVDTASPGWDATWPARIRQLADRALHSNVPEPQASLAAGLLLGGSSGLDPTLRAQLRTSGLAHLTSIDGYKQILVIGAVSRAAVHLVGRRFSLIPLLGAIATYTAVTGASAAAVRAGLMAGGAGLAALVGRVPDPLTSLMVTAAAMSLAWPLVLGDASFRMSVAATLGLILLYPRLQRWFSWLPRWAGEQIGISIAAAVATLPISLALFGEVSFVSPLAHVAAMPLVAPVMLASGALATMAWCVPLAVALAWLVWLLTTALIEVVRLSAAVPGASATPGSMPGWTPYLLATAIVIWGLLELPEAAPLVSQLHGLWFGRRRRRIGLALAIAIGAALVLWLVRPDGHLHVQRLLSGTGEALLVRGPNGATALVLGSGVDNTRLAQLVGDSLPPWERSLGAVVLLAPEAADALSETARRYAPATRVAATRDTRLDLGDGVALDVYADRGPGVAVRYGDVWVRLTGRPPPASQSQVYDATDGSGRELVSDGATATIGGR
jgi:competence protein ComEC